MAAVNRLVFARKLEKLGFLPALEVQNAIARQHLEKIKVKETSSAKNVLLFYEHTPVFTVGIRKKSVDAKEKRRLEDLGAEFHYTNRGGLVTFHGPGQLVCYPVLNLACFKKSLRWYVASLEKTLIETCKRFGVHAETTCDTGVWVKDNKIAAIGENRKAHGLLWDKLEDVKEPAHFPQRGGNVAPPTPPPNFFSIWEEVGQWRKENLSATTSFCKRQFTPQIRVWQVHASILVQLRHFANLSSLCRPEYGKFMPQSFLKCLLPIVKLMSAWLSKCSEVWKCVRELQIWITAPWKSELHKPLAFFLAHSDSDGPWTIEVEQEQFC